MHVPTPSTPPDPAHPTLSYRALVLGEEAAAHALFTDLIAGAYRLLGWMGARPADADEIVSEALFDLWRSRHRYDPTRSAPATYFGLLVRRCASAFHNSSWNRRRAGTVVGDVGDEDAESLEPTFVRYVLDQDASELFGLLAEIRATFSERQRRVAEMDVGTLWTLRPSGLARLMGDLETEQVRQARREIKKKYRENPRLRDLLLGGPDDDPGGGSGCGRSRITTTFLYNSMMARPDPTPRNRSLPITALLSFLRRDEDEPDHRSRSHAIVARVLAQLRRSDELEE